MGSCTESIVAMKVFLLSLLLAASCTAQSGDLLKELINDGSLNLCGSEVQPTTCTCADGTNFTPGNATTVEEGDLAVTAACPHPAPALMVASQRFQPEDVTD